MLPPLYNSLAESASRKSVAFLWVLKMEAGHFISPCKVDFTAADFRFSGQTQIIHFADNRVGIVSVIAYWGTAEMFGNAPSPTCWRRQASSSLTILTV